MENIILCGMMGCGKTTCANLLGGKLGRQVVDTDDLVVKKAGMSISELFAAQGEAAMRDLETEVARELSRRRILLLVFDTDKETPTHWLVPKCGSCYSYCLISLSERFAYRPTA